MIPFFSWMTGERFPYSNLHNLNQDWIIGILKEMCEKLPEMYDDITQKLNKPAEDGNIGEFLMNIGNGKTKWENIDTHFIPIITEAVNDWLNAHPEATTTVLDGAISESKLNTTLKNRLRSDDFVSSLKFPTLPFITMANANYTASQGMCVIDNQYIVVCRYYGSNQRAFRVYDAINKTFISESLLTDSEVGHVNSMCYYDGYIYIATLTEGSGIVRLRFNPITYAITYDDVVCTTMYPSVAIYDGNVFAMRYTEGGYWGCYVMDMTFSDPELLFQNNFAGTAEHLAIQGMTADEKYIYLAMSGDYSNGTGDNSNRMGRYTEYVYIIDRTGACIKTYHYSRGSYSEIEDVDIISIDGNKFLVINMNRNDANIVPIYIVPLYNYSEPITQFMTGNIDGIFNSEVSTFTIAISASGADDFPDGTDAHPFPNPASALDYIRRVGAPATIKLVDGSFAYFWIENIPVPLTIFLDGGHIDNLHIRRCGNITFDRNANVDGTSIGTGGFIIDESVVNCRYLASTIDGTGLASGSTAVKVYRSFLTGHMGQIKNFTNGITGITSVVMVTFTKDGVTNDVLTGSTIFGSVNGTAYGVS